MWEPEPLTTLRVSTACTGIALPLPSTTYSQLFKTYVAVTWDEEPNCKSGIEKPHGNNVGLRILTK
jgi:hypothetical protein